MSTPDFLSGKADVEGDALARLKELVAAWRLAKAAQEDAEEELKKKKLAFQKISQEEIPELLLAHGLSEIRLDTGEKVKVKEDVSVSIKDDRAFFAWLDSRNEGDIIKHAFKFGRLPDEQLEALHDWLLDNDFEYDDAVEVHSQTRKKYFRDLLGVGLDEEDFERGVKEGKIKTKSDVEEFASVFTYHTTKID